MKNEPLHQTSTATSTSTETTLDFSEEHWDPNDGNIQLNDERPKAVIDHRPARNMSHALDQASINFNGGQIFPGDLETQVYFG